MEHLIHKERNINLDILRIVAISAIILIHASGGFLIYNAFNNGAHWWIVSVIYSSTFKWATGVFVMLSGAFLLREDKSKDIWKFLKNRIIRIVIPFITWALIYKIIENPQDILNFKAYMLKNFVFDIYTGNVEYHLWFIYMLSILYILTPVFSAIVHHPNKKLPYYFVAVWFFIFFIPDYIDKFMGLQIGAQYYLEITKYSGFYILGYMLKNHIVKRKWLLFFGFIILSLVNAYGTYYLSNENGYNDYFFFSRLNATNILNSIFIFIFFNSLNLRLKENSKVKKTISTLSIISYGIFLNHVMVLNFFRSGKYGFIICSHSFLGNDVLPYFGILILFLFTFILSTIIAFLLYKIPFTNKLFV